MDGTIARRSTNNVHFVEESIPRFRICTWTLRQHGNVALVRATSVDQPVDAVCSQVRSRTRKDRLCSLKQSLLERVLLDGRPQLKSSRGLPAIDENRIDEAAARDLFWRDARRKLGKLRRLSPRDIWQVEILLAE
jgi:hypothetical protein